MGNICQTLPSRRESLSAPCVNAAAAALPAAAAAGAARPARVQGLILVHFSAQLERFLWPRECA